MANPHKAKGTAWESAVVTYLRDRIGGYTDPDAYPEDIADIRRQVQMGRADIGDVHAAPFVLECKNTATITLSAFVEQANREAANAKLPYGVAVVKRRGKGPAAGYVVMDLETFARVLAEIRANGGAGSER